jgi:hypothetical protein
MLVVAGLRRVFAEEPTVSNLECEPAADHHSAATEPLSAQSAIDWITEREDETVERLFALLEQNQTAIAALAQAWRHTRRALELTQADLAYTKRALVAERSLRGQRPAEETPRSHAAA